MLRDYLKDDLYNDHGLLPNNFSETIPDGRLAVQMMKAFKEEYLLDFINAEDLYAAEEDRNEPVLNKKIVAISDYTKPMGVATFQLGKNAPEDLTRVLPAPEDLSKCIEDVE